MCNKERNRKISGIQLTGLIKTGIDPSRSLPYCFSSVINATRPAAFRIDCERMQKLMATRNEMVKTTLTKPMQEVGLTNSHKIFDHFS